MKRYFTFHSYRIGWDRTGDDISIYFYVAHRYWDPQDEGDEDIFQFALPSIRFTRPNIWWKGKKTPPAWPRRS